jgi:hypothetical protein
MKKIKINQLEFDTLSRLEMSSIHGGNECGCACRFAEQGGASNDDNGWANNHEGTYSNGVPLEEQDIYCDDLEPAIITPNP